MTTMCPYFPAPEAVDADSTLRCEMRMRMRIITEEEVSHVRLPCLISPTRRPMEEGNLETEDALLVRLVAAQEAWFDNVVTHKPLLPCHGAPAP